MNWNTWRALVKADFLIRYQNSFLGFFWVFLKPFCIFLVLWFVFSVFGAEIPHFALSLLLGIILFQFFSDGTSFGMRTLLDRRSLLLKLSFSPESTLFASLTAPGIHLCFALMIFLGLCTWQDISLTGSGIGIVGILILCEWFLIGGMAFFLSLIAVHFRDMTEIWDMALVVLFYLTPIFYPLTLIPESVRNILWYNPLTQIVVFSRNAIFLQKFPEIHQIVFLLGLSVGIFIIGYVFFHFRIRRSLEKL